MSGDKKSPASDAFNKGLKPTTSETPMPKVNPPKETPSQTTPSKSKK